MLKAEFFVIKASDEGIVIKNGCLGECAAFLMAHLMTREIPDRCHCLLRLIEVNGAETKAYGVAYKYDEGNCKNEQTGNEQTGVDEKQPLNW